MNHLQACDHCPKQDLHFDNGCRIYKDLSWINRQGGCPFFPHRDLPEPMRKRVGQQKQKHQDRKYDSKNDRKSKFQGVFGSVS